MSLKRFVVISFLLVQLIYGQFLFGGGQQLENNSYLRDQTIIAGDVGHITANSTVLTDTESSLGDQPILADAGLTSIVQVPIYTQATTQSPVWNLFQSINLNALLGKATADLSKLHIMLITRKHCNNVNRQPVCKYIQTRYGLSETRALRKDPNFEIKRQTVIYFHGYEDSLNTEATQIIIDAYLQRNDHNLIVCDYHELLVGIYLKNAISNIQTIAPAIAQMIYTLNSKGVKLPLLHLVGHGLGAQIAGSVGKAYIELAEGTQLLQRITGLDPAFLYFYPPIGRHITSKDAHFVDIIHTDAWGYGAPVSTGSVDFWPNGGSREQPGCPSRDQLSSSKQDTCSHYRAVRFWAESLIRENSFLAMKCSSWYKFRKDMCQPKITAYMGYDAKPGITGNYHLQTNERPPFGRKQYGIIFDYID